MIHRDAASAVSRRETCPRDFELIKSPGLHQVFTFDLSAIIRALAGPGSAVSERPGRMVYAEAPWTFKGRRVNACVIFESARPARAAASLAAPACIARVATRSALAERRAHACAPRCRRHCRALYQLQFVRTEEVSVAGAQWGGADRDQRRALLLQLGSGTRLEQQRPRGAAPRLYRRPPNRCRHRARRTTHP